MIGEQKLKQKESDQSFYQVMVTLREQEKEARLKFKQDSVQRVVNHRTVYKEKLNEQVEARNKYRDKIIMRSDKMRALSDILAQEKIELNAL